MIHWLTTAPNPKSSPRGFNAGQRGWKLHAVEAPVDAKFSEIKRSAALCGLKPSHGWGLDLVIEDKCLRCEKKERANNASTN